MPKNSTAKPIVVATAVCGTLDIAWAMILTMWFGGEIPKMLRYVASGPFPQAMEMGDAGSLLGLAVHFALIAIMATVFVLAAKRIPDLTRAPLKWGVIYGLITYVVMNLIVIPLRFGTPVPPSTRVIATQLFAHIVLVGLPMALVTANYIRGREGIRAAHI